jgi:hypothetical protein
MLVDLLSLVQYTYVDCGCIHEDLFPTPPGLFRWITCECPAVFPRPKGRKNDTLFFLFDYLVALIRLRLFLSYMRLTGTVFSCRFGLLSKGSLNNSFVERLQIRQLCQRVTIFNSMGNETLTMSQKGSNCVTE